MKVLCISGYTIKDSLHVVFKMAWLITSIMALTACNNSIPDDAELNTNSTTITSNNSRPTLFGADMREPELIREHPRLILPELRGLTPAQFASVFASFYARTEADQPSLFKGCNDEDVFLHQLSCYVQTGRADARTRLLEVADRFKLMPPEDAAIAGNGWRLALLYDVVMIEGLEPATKQAIEAKLSEGIRQTLRVLDDDSATLYHHRATLASHAYSMAVALGKDTEESKGLFTRVWRHFADISAAVKLSGVWPEGYNYWVQNRAFPFVLAAGAYKNGTTPETYYAPLVDAYCEQMQWPLYAMRPDLKIEPMSDEGSRIDLAEETRPVIDMAAKLCGDGKLAQFSRFIAAHKTGNGYYYDYKWIYPISHGANTLAALTQKPMLSWIWQEEQSSHLFGRGAMNQLYYRDGRNEDAVFISARAGDTLSHHGHYDAGHFSLFYHAPIIVNASRYGSIFSDNRLYFSLRSVAKNTVLVLKPNERVKPNHLFKKNVAAGGQRITQPTGAAVVNVEHWLSLKHTGKHLQGADLTAYDVDGPNYLYMNSDLTKAYNSTWFDENDDDGKVERVQRTLAYFPIDKTLYVIDDIEKTHPEYIAKSLFHTMAKPEFSDSTVLAGTESDGIMLSTQTNYGIRNGKARAVLSVLEPGAPHVHIVGGHFYRFYVESDGDEKQLDGELINQPKEPQPWLDNPNWRIEVQASQPQKRNRHVVAISVETDRYPQHSVNLVHSDNEQVVIDGKSCRWHHFMQSPAKDSTLLTEQKNCVMFSGLSANQAYRVNAVDQWQKANAEGVLFWSVTPLTHSQSSSE